MCLGNISTHPLISYLCPHWHCSTSSPCETVCSTAAETAAAPLKVLFKLQPGIGHLGDNIGYLRLLIDNFLVLYNPWAALPFAILSWIFLTESLFSIASIHAAYFEYFSNSESLPSSLSNPLPTEAHVINERSAYVRLFPTRHPVPFLSRARSKTSVTRSISST